MSARNRYKATTRLVHGPDHSAKWDFTHYVTPPLSSSTTYRMDSARRGARGFHSLLTSWYPAMGIQIARIDMNDVAALRARVTDATRVLYFESPANPTLELVDIAALRELTGKVNESRPAECKLLIFIDNTFATPFGQRPLEHGADVVLHSLTKNLGGFGTELGGAVICPREMLVRLLLYRKDFGGILGSKSAWAIMVYGLPTLPLRLKRQQYTAQKVAEWLAAHPTVQRVVYPGLPSKPGRPNESGKPGKRPEAALGSPETGATTAG